MRSIKYRKAHNLCPRTEAHLVTQWDVKGQNENRRVNKRYINNYNKHNNNNKKLLFIF